MIKVKIITAAHPEDSVRSTATASESYAITVDAALRLCVQALRGAGFPVGRSDVEALAEEMPRDE